MTIAIELSEEAEQHLRKALGNDLARAVLEALCIEGYRSGKLGSFQVQRILGLEGRQETWNWLGDHGVKMNYNLADLEADRRTLRKIFGPD